MKDKLQKRNMTGFDYRARRLGILGGIIIILSLAVLLPIATTVANQNVALGAEIQELNAQIENNETKVVVEKK